MFMVGEHNQFEFHKLGEIYVEPSQTFYEGEKEGVKGVAQLITIPLILDRVT